MFYDNTLNLKQELGGSKIKQGDFGSVLSFILLDGNNSYIDELNQKTASISLCTDDKILYVTTATINNSTVEFKIDKAIPAGVYYVEIKVDNYIFPSDRSTIISIEQGATVYDLKDLIPNYDVSMTLTDILNKLNVKDGQVIDLQNKMNAIYSNALSDHAEILNAKETFATLDSRLDGIEQKEATDVSNLNNKITTNTNNIATTNTRLDGIIANAGNGTVPSELIDARTLSSSLNFPIAGDAIRYVNNKLDSSFSRTFSLIKATELPDVKIEDGYYDNGAGGLVAYSSYTTYSFAPNEDIIFYFEKLLSEYITITVYTDSNKSAVVTARGQHTVSSTDFSKIPTIDNPLTVKKGNYVVISLNKSSTARLINTDYSKVKVLLSQAIYLNTTQVNQIKKDVIKQCYFRYNASPESIDIFIPTKVGYVRYYYLHSIKPTFNSDVWRMETASATDDYFVDRYTMTTSGEWEMAITLEGRPDFVGGLAHGDEVQTSFNVIVDGVLTDVKTTSGLIPFDKMTFVATSDMFDPNDSLTKVGEHGSEHIFSKNGLNIKQTVKWMWTGNTTTAFLAMLPISKTYSDKFYTNKSMNLINIPSETRESGITEVTVNKSDLGISAKFGIKEYPTLEMFMMIDNGGGPYNKCYYKILPQAVTDGDIWHSETYYNFEIGK
ncbi:hypothetical protein [Streptococcus uberis]|uniref:hypothetical protein n=1 Tax=Streptococcus uberis TaxID=1349 RepID=UPI000DFA3CA8|nr:hypothetical protein [Streptococcus uberis]SUO90948.1 phage tail fiber [Streptococcus uberis]